MPQVIPPSTNDLINGAVNSLNWGGSANTAASAAALSQIAAQNGWTLEQIAAAAGYTAQDWANIGVRP